MLTNNYKTYKIVGFLQEQFEIGEGVFSGETFLDNLEDNKEYNVFFTVINNKNKTKLVNETFDNLNLDRNFNYINVNNDLLALIGESEYTCLLYTSPYTRRVLGIPNNQLQEDINKNGIPGLVRVSLGIYNSKKEANIFLETVERLCRRYAR